MPRALPLVLSPLDLPREELLASRLDGELFRLENGFCPIDEIVRPAHRAAVVMLGLPARLIPELLTAAWIWGAMDRAPTVPQFCVRLDARVAHPLATGMRVREVVLGDGDTIKLNAITVASPLRTAVDLARVSDRWTSESRRVTRALMDVGRFGPADIVSYLDARHKLPEKRRALARISAL